MKSKEPKVGAASDYYLYLPSAVASRLYLYPIAVGYFYYEAGYDLTRHTYDSFLLMQIVKGCCTAEMNGRQLTAQRGQFLLLDCHGPHEYSFPVDSEVVWIHFDGPLARSYYDLITAGHGNVLTPDNEYPITHALSKILSRFRESAPIREASLSGYLTQALEELMHIRQDSDSSSSSSQVIENSLVYINEHFSEPITLEMLASQASLSPYYFTRVFTAETGFTPHQYLIAMRINSAKFLLKTHGMSIKEIAFSCGFNSESSFCSTFKKWEQVTPSEYRAHALPD